MKSDGLISAYEFSAGGKHRKLRVLANDTWHTMPFSRAEWNGLFTRKSIEKLAARG